LLTDPDVDVPLAKSIKKKSSRSNVNPPDVVVHPGPSLKKRLSRSKTRDATAAHADVARRTKENSSFSKVTDEPASEVAPVKRKIRFEGNR
jgi:hypothetical protein